MRGMGKVMMKGAPFVLALLAFTPNAWSAAGLTYTEVKALTTPVTYSRDIGTNNELKPLVAFAFSVTNTSGNTINNVTVEATATAKHAPEGFPLTLASVDNASCVLVTPPLVAASHALTLSCPFGQLKAGAGKTFTVFFFAPTKGAVEDLADYVGIRGRTITAEGTDKGKSPNDSVDYWPVDNPATTTVTETFDSCDGNPLDPAKPQAGTHDCIKAALGTPDVAKVRSAVSKQGGTFFTGIGGVPGYTIGTELDKYTTTVVVPPGFVATATVAEAASSQTTCDNLSNSLNECFSTDLTVRDTEQTTIDFSPDYLTIIVRIDSTNIKPGTKIKNVKIYYESSPNEVADCNLVGNKPVPFGNGVPCVAKRVAYPKNLKGSLDPALSLDFEFWILNDFNGVYNFF